VTRTRILALLCCMSALLAGCSKRSDTPIAVAPEPKPTSVEISPKPPAPQEVIKLFGGLAVLGAEGLLKQ
jgi:PBP1b-binding outer membrane lipoprotein LpoB